MTYEEFKTQYDNHKNDLKRIVAELNGFLQQGLHALDPPPVHPGDRHMFRIRLQEARIKEFDSLYWKVKRDPELDFERVFTEPGHVRDLIGARIVCHNLSDVITIGEYFEHGNWPVLNYVIPPKGPKKCVKQPSPDGYRGWHFDAQWISPGSELSNYAEIQIRTLLQDAWASFMHDDIYKPEVRHTLLTEMFEHFKLFSDLLYTLDEMAQGLRGAVTALKVSSDSHIGILEIRSHYMDAMVDVKNRGITLPNYTKVSRRDCYTVLDDHGHFSFEFKGVTHERCSFVFPIAGETEADNFLYGSVTRIRGSDRKSVDRDAMTVEPSEKSANVMVLTHKGHRTKTHHYDIACQWRGVFQPGHEHIWCPWRDFYPNADVEYSLAVRFETPPRIAPRLYDVKGVHRLKEVLQLHGTRTDAGIGADEYKDPDGFYRYTFAPITESGNFLCLFSFH